MYECMSCMVYECTHVYMPNTLTTWVQCIHQQISYMYVPGTVSGAGKLSLSTLSLSSTLTKPEIE